MKKYKIIFKFVSAIILLIMIPLLPLSISKLKDDNLLGHLQIETVKRDNDKNIQTSDLSIVEKLKLISSYGYEDNKIIVTSQVEDMNDLNVASIRKVINDELGVLQGLGILTNFSFDESYTCNNFITKRYSDVVDAKQSVSLYQVSFINEENFFQVWIDKETNKVFQYDYSSKKYVVVDSKLLAVFGKDYLGISLDDAQRYFTMYVDEKMNAIHISLFDVSSIY